MARKPPNEPSLVPILTAPVPRGTSAHKPSFQRIRLSKPAAQTSARQQAHAPPAASGFTPLPFTTNESALSNFQRIASFNQPSQLPPIPALANPLRQEVPQRQSFRRIKPTSSGTRRIKLKTSSPLQVVIPSRPSEVNSRRVSGESATPSLPVAPNGAAQRLRGRGPVGAQDDDLLHKDNALDNEENEDGIAGDSGAFFGNRVTDSLSGGDDGIQFIGSLSRPALSSTVAPASPKSPFVHTPTIPLTYYTTFTYYTTVIRGPHTAMLSRELVSSTTAVKPIDRSIVTAIEFSEGYIQPSKTQVPLGTKTKGQTTTIFNMASRVQVFNDDLYKVIYATRASSKPLEHTRILPLSSFSVGAVSSPESLPKVSLSSAAPSRVSSSAVRIEPTRSLFPKPVPSQSRVPVIMLSKWEDLDSQPKRLLTKYTYFYTFIDGAQTRYSTRKEESTAPFKGTLNTMASALDSSIDSDGNLQILSPKSATVALGSRANGRMTTVVNLALKNYVQFDKVRNFQIKPTSVVASSPTLQTPTPSLTPSFEESPVVSSSVNRVSSEMLSSQLETPRLSSEILFKSSSVISTSATLVTSSQLRTRPSQSRRPFRVKLKPLRSKLAAISRVSNQLALSSSPSLLEPWSSMISSESTPSASPLLSPSPSPALSSTQVPISSTSIADPIVSLTSVQTTPSATPTRKKVAYTVRRPVSGVNRYFNRRPSSYLVRSSTAFALPSSVFSTVSSFEYLSPSLASSSAVFPTVSYISSFSPQYISPSSTILEPFSGLVSSPVFKPSKVSKSRFVVTRLAGNLNKWNPLYASRIRVSSRKVLKSTGVPEISSISIEPTSVVETIFETTLHTVPFTLGSTTIYTTLEEVHSRIVTRSEEQTEPSQLSPSFEPKVSPVKPTTESSMSASPTMSFETKTQLTTLTHFNTIYTSGTSIVTSSEQTLSSLVSAVKLALVSPTVIVETSDSVTTSTLYSTYTYFATLFNGTRTMITPLEEVKTEYLTLREPVTITRTIVPTIDIRPSSSMQPIQASRSVSSIEPMFSAVQPLDGSFVTETYSTHTTLTHFITLFSGTRTILSSIEEVSPTEMTRTRMVLVTDSASIGETSSSVVESSRLSPLILEMASEPIKSASVGSVYSSSTLPSSSIQPSASLLESTRGSYETMSPSVVFSGVLFNKAQVDGDVASAMPTALVIGPSTTLVDERDSMSTTASIEPGSVIELNDLLQGVQDAGQIGETIKDIVNNIVTRPETTDEESTTTESNAEETTEPLTDLLVTTPMNVKVSTLAPSFNPSAEKTPSLNAIKKADAKFPVYVAPQNLAKYKTSSEEKVIFSTQADGNGEPGQPMSTRYVTSIEKSAKTLTLTKTQV